MHPERGSGKPGPTSLFPEPVGDQRLLQMGAAVGASTGVFPSSDPMMRPLGTGDLEDDPRGQARRWQLLLGTTHARANHLAGAMGVGRQGRAAPEGPKRRGGAAATLEPKGATLAGMRHNVVQVIAVQAVNGVRIAETPRILPAGDACGVATLGAQKCMTASHNDDQRPNPISCQPPWPATRATYPELSAGHQPIRGFCLRYARQKGVMVPPPSP